MKEKLDKLKELFEIEHFHGCGQNNCAMNAAFENGMENWSIELFSSTGASSEEFDKIYSSLNHEEFKKLAEKDRQDLVEQIDYRECPSCNSVIWDVENCGFEESFICDGCHEEIFSNLEEHAKKCFKIKINNEEIKYETATVSEKEFNIHATGLFNLSNRWDKIIKKIKNLEKSDSECNTWIFNSSNGEEFELFLNNDHKMLSFDWMRTLSDEIIKENLDNYLFDFKKSYEELKEFLS